jgi:2-polyprenyl-3-methyl-5-hydroxy-6-metoxy-1,4-benzoquinol methylase
MTLISAGAASEEKSMHTRPGSVGGSSDLLRFVDVQEQYGRHVIEKMLARLSTVHLACDLGVGYGHDLSLVRKRFPEARLIGIDYVENQKLLLQERGIELQVFDLEREALPFDDGSVDLVIANQVLEHMKELFWISHQVALKLRLGGHMIIGVPNIGALHNRLTFLFGKQPSQMKSYSAHVRGFTAYEIPHFFSVCFPGGFQCELLCGAQFYPFPRLLARILARLFPTLAHSTFYLMQKTAPYAAEFLKHPVEAGLATPFFLGQAGQPTHPSDP